MRAIGEGRDPSAEKKPATDTVAAAVEQYLVRHVGRHYREKSRYAAERYLRKYVVEHLGDRKIHAVTRADLRAMLDRLVDDTPVLANRLHANVRKFFNWCVEQDILATSPCTGLKPPAGREVSRDRVLTDVELRLVWLAAERMGYPWGTVVQLLALTGQRRGEVAGMRWAELDMEKRLWTLPAERTKNKRKHEVPLSPAAMAIIDRLPRTSDEFVFSVRGTPVTGFGYNWDRLRELLPPDMPQWVVHDLRRTAASGMAALGVSLPVIEKVLNHVSGSLAGIVGVYQRHEFAAEKRAALRQWADHVERLVRS